jgi:uncharacterized protein YutE (UPF0331/DUF86 family)
MVGDEPEAGLLHTRSDGVLPRIAERALKRIGLGQPRRWSGLARVGNRLVHLYWDVDEWRIHDYLQDGLLDIESFANAIARREWSSVGS